MTGPTIGELQLGCGAHGRRFEPCPEEHGRFYVDCPICDVSRMIVVDPPADWPAGAPLGDEPAEIRCMCGCDRTTVIAALRSPAGRRDGGEHSPVRFLDVAAMVAAPPPPVAWLAPPILARATLTALYAPGGDGKSLFAGALACALARGSEVAGIPCKTGTTVYLDGENGEHEIWRRVHTLGMPAAGVRVADASGFDLRRDFELLGDVVHESRPDALTLDSLRSLTPGLDENDTKQTAAALDPLRRLAHESGVAILLIHHANKKGDEYRGASSIRDSVDVLWHMGREDGDEDRHRRFLTCRKMRVAAEPSRMWLRLEADRGRVLVDQAEEPVNAAASMAVQQPVRTALSDRILAEMNGRPTRLADIARLVGRKPKDGSVRNAVGALVSADLLRRDGDFYLRVQEGANEDDASDCTFAPGVQSANALKESAPLHPVSTDPYTASVQRDAP